MWICVILKKIFPHRTSVFLFLFLVYVLLPIRFPSNYNYIPDDMIESQLLSQFKYENGTCQILPKLSMKMIDINPVYDYNETVFGLKHDIKLGGRWKPWKCQHVHVVAIIVPYRGRPEQLAAFLHHMHTFLQKQFLSYQIFIIEQTYNDQFNRGKLMNVGYKEALDTFPFHCFIFHDVDLLPQVERNMYACTKSPRHFSTSINVWRYNLIYDGAFGGVTALTKDQFASVNGFSNLYWGWGGEDDDMLKRVNHNHLGCIRFSPAISRYYMLHHRKQAANPERVNILRGTLHRYAEDGLSSLMYKVVLRDERPLYTHIVVEI